MVMERRRTFAWQVLYMYFVFIYLFTVTEHTSYVNK